uniref:ATP synthase F0 subunit 8 n=1 Tax=Urolabida sp. FS-2019 TaxID=2575687 RepID=A0A4D6X0U8_9HEMI|nr:ATP synthase F0 subunit 8 [Urolabida sp. FS-2019]
MPQMMPLWWEILMIMFIISMITFSIMIYHNKKITFKSFNTQYIKKSNLWMW